MLKIFITDRAEQALLEITDFYIVENVTGKTAEVLNSIDVAFRKIANSPTSYSICFDIRTPQENIRQYILQDTFKIVYRIQEDVIEIIEVFHASRIPDLLEDIG